jgi:hypothetical protein
MDIRTVINLIENAQNPASQLVAQVRGDKNISLDLTVRDPTTVSLDQLWSEENRKQGYGNQKMQELCSVADQLGVKLTLTAHPLHYDLRFDHYDDDDRGIDKLADLNDQAMSEQQLIKWYTKFGFEFDPDHETDGVRLPRTPGTINESRSAPVYHGTSSEGAYMIAKSGVLKAGRIYSINGKNRLGISVSRDERLNYSNEDGPGSAAVIFVLNQQNIAARYQMVPYNDRGFSRVSQTTESEEVIVAKELPLNNKTVELIILRDPAEGVVEWAQKLNIPYQIEYLEIDPDDDW